MQLAARSSFAAGVAVVGAGILVAAPVAPPIPELPDPLAVVRSAAVDLSALANPLALLSPRVQDASSPADVLEIGRSALSSLPTPQELLEVASEFVAVFGTALSDAPAQIQLAVQQISAGQITGALDTLVNIVLAPVTGPVLDAIFSGSGPLVKLVGLLQRPFENVAPIKNVIGLLADPDFLLTIGLGPLQAVYALTSAVGGTAEAMLDAVEAGNPGAFVSSFIKGVGDVTEVVLDRLLNPGSPPYGYDRGLIAGLIEAGKMIFAALTAPAAAVQPVTAAITATSTEPAATVTLSTTPAEAEADPVADPESTAPVADEAAPEVTEEATPEVTDEVTEEVTEEDVVVTPAVDEVVDEEASEEPDVRTGLVAVPGEVTVGVDDSDDATSEADETANTGAAQPTSPSGEDADDSGTDTGTTGASDGSDGGDSGGSDGGDSGGSGSDSGSDA